MPVDRRFQPDFAGQIWLSLCLRVLALLRWTETASAVGSRDSSNKVLGCCSLLVGALLCLFSPAGRGGEGRKRCGGGAAGWDRAWGSSSAPLLRRGSEWALLECFMVKLLVARPFFNKRSVLCRCARAPSIFLLAGHGGEGEEKFDAASAPLVNRSWVPLESAVPAAVSKRRWFCPRWRRWWPCVEVNVRRRRGTRSCFCDLL